MTTTKSHFAVDAMELLLIVVVTAAHVQDPDGAYRLLAALRAHFSFTISHVWADLGYAGRLLVCAKKVLSFTVEVVKRTDAIAGFPGLPGRWVVEPTFGWITKHRQCVRDYGTLPEHDEAMVTVAMIMTVSRRLSGIGGRRLLFTMPLAVRLLERLHEAPLHTTVSIASDRHHGHCLCLTRTR